MMSEKVGNIMIIAVSDRGKRERDGESCWILSRKYVSGLGRSEDRERWEDRKKHRLFAETMSLVIISLVM